MPACTAELVVAVVAGMQMAVVGAPRASPAAPAWPDYQPLGGAPGRFMSMGNHRFNITLAAGAEAAGGASALATLVWRRSDSSPLAKAVFVTSGGGASATAVPCRVVAATADSATLSFTPIAGQRHYAAYYLPFTVCRPLPAC